VRRSEPRPDPETLVLAVRADVTGIFPNPPIVNEAFTTQVNWNIFEGLVGLDRDLYLRPAIAENWSASPDAANYVFNLRPGLRFSDGRPLTASDVVASLLHGRDGVYSDSLHSIADARALDVLRVEVRTHTAYLALITRLPWGLVLPEDAWRRAPVPAIGTGPYRLVSWDKGERILLEANPHFRGPRPSFRRVSYRVMPDDGARMDAVLSGAADAADSLPLAQADALVHDPRVRPLVREGLRVIFLALRPNGPPFDEPRVREAIDLAIDREELIRQVLHGRGVPASQLVPPAIPGYNPELKTRAADRTRARALLAEAGHGGGLTIDLYGPNNRYVSDVAVLDELSRQLALVGIAARATALDKAVFFPMVSAGKTRLHLMGWSSEAGDAGDALDALAHSKDGRGLGSENDMDLSDPQLDRLIRRANETFVGEDRIARLKTAMERLVALRVYLPLYVQPESALVSRAIEWDPAPSLAFVAAEMRRNPF
jgi:peptide/nickel transport system substrate-binding protein